MDVPPGISRGIRGRSVTPNRSFLRRLITEVCPRPGIPSNRCYVWDTNPFECHCFGRVPLWETCNRRKVPRDTVFRREADITSAKSSREKLCSGCLVGIQRGPLRDPSPLGTMRREAWPLVSRVAHEHALETLRIARTSSNICESLPVFHAR